MDVFDVTSLFKPNRSGFAFPLSPIAASISALFSRDFEATGSLGADATFTRSSTATVTDFEGLVKIAKINEARFSGLRRVENLITLSSENLQVGWGARDGAVITGQDSVTFGAVNNSRLDRGFILPAYSQKIIYRVDVKADDAGSVGKAFVLQAISGSAGGYSTLGSTSYTLTDTYSTIALSFTSHVSDFAVIPLLKCNELTTVKVNITNVQIENVTGQTNQNPSEYVSVGVLSAPYHGANVDGIKYFATENGNSVVGNVVTEGTGAAIAGGYLLMEPAATNLVTVSTPTDAFWSSKVQCTITDNAAIGPFGKNDAALYTVTGTGNNYAERSSGATYSSGVTYTFTHYAKAGTLSWFLGAAPNGVFPAANRFVWFDVSNGIIGTQQSNIVSASIEKVGDWYRCRFSITATSTGASTPGYLVAVDGNNSTKDASGVGTMYFGHVQVEANSTGTSEILTSGSAVTRAAESLSYSGIAADNETRAITDAGTVDVDDWDGIVDATINGADNLAQITSIDVYTTGERPA